MGWIEPQGDAFAALSPEDLPEALPAAGLLEEPRAAAAASQQVPYELPGFPPGELGAEKALDDLVREVLVRHVIPPGSQEIN